MASELHPNNTHYEFNSGLENVIDSLVERVDPGNENLRAQCAVWMDLSTIINKGFTSLGISSPLWVYLEPFPSVEHDVPLYLGILYCQRRSICCLQLELFNRRFTRCVLEPRSSSIIIDKKHI